MIARVLAFACAAVLVAGCVYHKPTRTGCEESTRTFSEMAMCLDKAIGNAYTARERSGNEVRLYYIKADFVAERVKKDLISEYDGRNELAQLYVGLRAKTEVQ